MFAKYRLLLMFVVIFVGFCLLVIVYVFNPSRLRQGESLCLKYLPFYEREITSGQIDFIDEIPKDHGALEIHIVEQDTSYSIRIYEPIYEGFSLLGKRFYKKINSYELILIDGSVYKIIRTCDNFY